MANDEKRPIAVDDVRCPDCAASLLIPERRIMTKRDPKTGDIVDESLEVMADYNLRITSPQEASCSKCDWRGHVTFGRRV